MTCQHIYYITLFIPLNTTILNLKKATTILNLDSTHFNLELPIFFFQDKNLTH
jgi:hypothetical protein